jgi:hypothetical protein
MKFAIGPDPANFSLMFSNLNFKKIGFGGKDPPE